MNSAHSESNSKFHTDPLQTGGGGFQQTLKGNSNLYPKSLVFFLSRRKEKERRKERDVMLPPSLES
ncbi:hypothetical protein OIU84_022756 [Salix udensis]|uniref:Uncharacterized protein n=1 Tax=Salix udensis TaxID=889485 RepID=A0AAD6KPJ8_9ROSI|nr:hypothetical protein OIU84_022756 [Salix udensis]